MIASNFPSQITLPDRYYTQNVDAVITGGNAVKDGGEMSCLFLWTEFLAFLDNMRSKTHHERLIPFAIGVSDGESGYNIDSKFAFGSTTDVAVYSSAKVFGNTATEMGKKFNEVQLYRYIFPLLERDAALVTKKKSVFIKEINADQTYTSFDIGNNYLAVMDNGYGGKPDGKQTQMITEDMIDPVTKTAKFWNKKIAVYNRSLFPYCKQDTPYDLTKARAAWTGVFDTNKFDVAFEMGDGGMRVSNPVSGGATVTTGGTTYIGQGNLTPTTAKVCTVDKAQTITFKEKQSTPDDQSADPADYLKRASTYAKSYWMLQLFGDDNFALGINGKAVVMTHDLGKVAVPTP